MSLVRAVRNWLFTSNKVEALTIHLLQQTLTEVTGSAVRVIDWKLQTNFRLDHDTGRTLRVTITGSYQFWGTHGERGAATLYLNLVEQDTGPVPSGRESLLACSHGRFSVRWPNYSSQAVASPVLIQKQ